MYTPTLTGLGERSHLLSRDIDLSCHIQDVVNVLTYEDLEKVILVGHSYGGMVITGVADKCPERLSQIVYLDALVPKNGQSALDVMAITSTARVMTDEQSVQENWLLPPLSAEALGVTDPDDVEWLEKKLTPHPLGTTTEQLHLSNPVAERLSRVFISCTVHRTKLIPSVAKMGERISNETGWHYHELETGHNAMITVPQKLAQILISLV